jgi:hypothetical protein
VALRNPGTRLHLVQLIAVLADPELQRREWVTGRPGWEQWADEFYDDVNDGLSAVESADGAVDPYDAIGDTLRDAREAEVLLRLLEIVNDANRDRTLPSREAAALAFQHPRWPDVIQAAAAARAVLDDLLPDQPPAFAP